MAKTKEDKILNTTVGTGIRKSERHEQEQEILGIKKGRRATKTHGVDKQTSRQGNSS